MSARDWQPGDKALIEVEVVMLGQSRTWAEVLPGGDSRVTSVYVDVEHLRPVPAAGEAATEDAIERARKVARKAVADEFYAMQGGDPEWAEAPEPNAGDDSVGSAVVRALAAAGLLAGVPGRSEAETQWGVRFGDGDVDKFADRDDAAQYMACIRRQEPKASLAENYEPMTLVQRTVIPAQHGPWTAARVADTTDTEGQD